MSSPCPAAPSSPGRPLPRRSDGAARSERTPCRSAANWAASAVFWDATACISGSRISSGSRPARLRARLASGGSPPGRAGGPGAARRLGGGPEHGRDEALDRLPGNGAEGVADGVVAAEAHVLAEHLPQTDIELEGQALDAARARVPQGVVEEVLHIEPQGHWGRVSIGHSGRPPGSGRQDEAGRAPALGGRGRFAPRARTRALAGGATARARVRRCGAGPVLRAGPVPAPESPGVPLCPNVRAW